MISVAVRCFRKEYIAYVYRKKAKGLPFSYMYHDVTVKNWLSRYKSL